MPSPTGGTKANRAKTIAAVVRKPSFELPGPATMIHLNVSVKRLSDID